MLKISPPSDLFPLVRSHSVSSQSLRSPPIFAGDGSAVAAYPEIRRQANLPASPYPFRPSPSLPPIPAIPSAPRHFSLATAPPSPRIQRFAVRRIFPLGRTRSASRHPFPIPAIPPAPRHFSLAARSVAAYPKIRRQANLPALVGEDCQGGGRPPSLTPRLPSHAPPFPQPSFTLGGGCREGGSPPDFPSCPAALPAGTGRFPHFYRNPQSCLVRTPRPSRSSNLGTAEIASF